MKKQLLAVLTASVLAAPAMAADNQWFVGAEGGFDTNGFKKGALKEEKRPEFGVRVGKYFADDKARVYATYRGSNLGKRGDRMTARDLLVSADYLVPLTQSKSVNWFIGGTVGGSQLNNDNVIAPELQSTTVRERQNNFVYGGQTGFKFNLAKHFEMELGYQYLRHNGGKNGIKLDADQRVNLAATFKF
ncbi:outer membrane beta-barrel protein [Paraferrimonas sedimenticola]|uniref:Outer membrane protein beta-barrel domain-containing protein n=1 Tax=Paraferrimonas sedimenticola TaxID=375674 RepID=A0AA37RXF7_9GAMM|nr:outer membrane beta-barrel protein [Paraferrimonas sedimenticola]GLP96773.1 hypothetical protein GCM10007895_20790 [Paraferrimonas sedimenticola]